LVYVNLNFHKWQIRSGVTKGITGGMQLPAGAAGEGPQNSIIEIFYD